MNSLSEVSADSVAFSLSMEGVVSKGLATVASSLHESDLLFDRAKAEHNHFFRYTPDASNYLNEALFSLMEHFDEDKRDLYREIFEHAISPREKELSGFTLKYAIGELK